jgi:formylglycine-generating enzyme required for sulfatase activity
MDAVRRAILIGSSEFADARLTRLRCPDNDVEGLRKLLCSEAQSGYYREVVSLRNKPHYEVLKAVNVALRRANKDDFVLIYYSGHGKLDRAGCLYLAASDTEVDALEATSIPVESILHYVRLSNCRNVGLILDCCYSGAIGDSIFKGGVEEQLQQASRSAGVYVLTASTGVQVAEEKEKDEYGLLTKYIIQGIENGEADAHEAGQISMDDLYRYVHPKVKQEGFQEPMKWDLSVRGELIVARSGKTPREERRKQIRAMLLKYAEQHLISDRLLSQALHVLALRPDELQGDLRRCDDLLRQLLDKRLPLGEFIDQWYGLDPGVPEPQRRRQAPAVRVTRSEEPKAGDVKTNPDDGQPYVWIPPGEFQMGCSPGDSEGIDHEKPPHTVRITRGFWLGQTPVTVGAYRRFSQSRGISMPAEPVLGKRKLNPEWSDSEQPMVAVTWEEAKAYCESWAKGRLPTEAEWEYAARAGTTGARYGELDAIAWHAGNSGSQRLDSVRAWEKDADRDWNKYLQILETNGNRIHPIKQKQPDAWGLYDMLGNVWEWVEDWYQQDYYGTLPSPNVDPQGPPEGTARVLRGGSWNDIPTGARASVRAGAVPESRNTYFGFRAAREVIP